MAGMKRFVTYIYAYEEGKKGNNIGFAKVEIRGMELRMEIHLRGVYASQTKCLVYLFREQSGDMEGVRIGEMQLAKGAGDFGVLLNTGRIKDTPFGFGDMEGIFLRTEDERIFMSRWKEGAPLVVDHAHFKEWQSMPQKERTAQKSAEAAAAASTGEAEEMPAVVDNPQKEQENAEAAAAAPTGEAAVQPRDIAHAAVETAEEAQENARAAGAGENMQATEIPMRNFFPEYCWEEIWEELCEGHPVLTPLADREARCIQIELKDLKELPKKYWYLGNNSFLLHGFFNYRYLVVGKTGEGRWFLGVPGIYQRQERVMAAIFGFPEFLAAAVPGESGQEGEPVNRFGCWCRYIEE